MIKKRLQIPDGKIIFSDFITPAQSIFSSKIGLSGKPDYILKTKQNDMIPVEVKTGYHSHAKPWHVMQLISYCFLLTEVYKKNIPFGILIYSDSKKQFKIPFSNSNRSELLSIINDMRNYLFTNTIDRNHNKKERCIKCSMKSHCSKRLDEK